MYVDDRLGRRSRARSGLDQLDVAEDLFAVVAAAVAVGGAAVFHVGMGDRLRFSSSSGFASEFRFDDTGAVLLVPLEGRRESSDIDGRRTRDDVRTGSSVLTDRWSPRPFSRRSAEAWPRCLT